MDMDSGGQGEGAEGDVEKAEEEAVFGERAFSKPLLTIFSHLRFTGKRGESC
jgi:hypothetical protein